MTHPVVYRDAWQRAKNVEKLLNIDVNDILTQDLVERDTPWVLFETASSSDTRLGLGESFYLETGQIWLHLMVLRGCETLQILEILQHFLAAYRQNGTVNGLSYTTCQTDPPDSSEIGNWVKFSISVDYEFQQKINI